LPGVDWARTEHHSDLGRWAVGWEHDQDRLALIVTVPEGGTAELITPPGFAPADRPLGPGDHTVVLINS